jgi:hypothetical protein
VLAELFSLCALSTSRKITVSNNATIMPIICDRRRIDSSNAHYQQFNDAQANRQRCVRPQCRNRANTDRLHAWVFSHIAQGLGTYDNGERHRQTRISWQRLKE